MQQDKLEWWEKWPIGAVFTAQGLYVAEWYVGARMPSALAGVMAWLAVFGGVAAWVAIDGAMIATVMGMRQGRRSWWSILAIVVTAAFGAAVALDLYGAFSRGSAWLHAGFALTIVCYLLHAAAPRVTHRADTLARERDELEAKWLDASMLANKRGAEVTRLGAEVARLEGLVAQTEADLVQQRNEMEQRDAELARLRRDVERATGELAQARHEVARLTPPEGGEWFVYNGERFTLAELAKASGAAPSTLRRGLNRVRQNVAAAAD